MGLEPRDLIGLSGTFLGDLGHETLTLMLEGAQLHEIRRGESLFPPEAGLRSGVILEGTARTYLPGPGGTQLTLRYVRPGSLASSASSRAGGAAVAIRFQAVTDCSVIELDVDRVQALRATRPTIHAAATEELGRRLEEVYRSFAATVQATLRERLAVHLLEIAQPGEPGPLHAPAPQRDLADTLGTRREVISRTLAELAREGIVATSRGGVTIIAPARLVAIAGRWWHGTRVVTVDSASPTTTFDAIASAVVGIDMKGDVIYANPRVRDTFGWSADEIIGSPITKMLPPEVAQPFGQMFGSYMADVQPGPIGLGSRYHGLRADGSQFPAQITILPTRTTNGMIVFATVVDLTYRQVLRDYLKSRAPQSSGGNPRTA